MEIVCWSLLHPSHERFLEAVQLRCPEELEFVGSNTKVVVELRLLSALTGVVLQACQCCQRPREAQRSEMS